MVDENRVPVLRFPQFEEAWNKEPIGRHIDLLSGFAFNGEDILEDSTGIPLLRGVNIGEGKIRHSRDIDRYYNGNATNLERFYLEKDDLVIGMDGSKVGKNSALITKNDRKALLIQRVARLRAKRNSSIQFIFQHINSKIFTQYVDKVKTSSGIPHISSKQINDFKIYFPESVEQQKIANFLTSVDEHISLLSKKKEKLEQYKKGIMQGIFSKDKMHRLSFKDENGNPYPEWEEKRLGDIYSFVPTNSFSREKLNYENGDVKNIHYGDIHTKFRTQFDIEKEEVPFVNTDVDISRISEDNYVSEGDLIMADASEDYADIGKSIEIINLNGEKVLSGLHTLLAKQRDNALVSGFGGHLMKSYNMRLEIMRIAQGSKVLSISTGRISNISCRIPFKPEQQKIANFLSAINQKIEQVGVQIEKSQQFKKGLVQKMFV